MVIESGVFDQINCTRRCQDSNLRPHERAARALTTMLRTLLNWRVLFIEVTVWHRRMGKPMLSRTKVEYGTLNCQLSAATFTLCHSVLHYVTLRLRQHYSYRCLISYCFLLVHAQCPTCISPLLLCPYSLVQKTKTLVLKNSSSARPIRPSFYDRTFNLILFRSSSFSVRNIRM